MVAVAVVAAVGASARMATLRARYVTIARWRAVDAVEARGLAEFWDDQAAQRRRSADEIASDRAEARSWRSRAAWNDRMKRKYEQAARAPWLPVEPDPPQP
jgi:uncharacterized protein YdaU (DUF1376 family)